MIYTKIVELPLADIKRLQSIIDGTIPFPDQRPHGDEIMCVSSFDFGDGWEIDINIVKGQPTPYLDAILYHHGCEVYGWDISEEIMGEWTVVLGGELDVAFRYEIAPEGTI